MICPSCWAKPHPDIDTEQFGITLLDPLLPEDISRLPGASDFWDGIIREEAYEAREESLVIAGQEVRFQYAIATGNKRTRVRHEFACQNCGFVWDHFEGDPHLETYKMKPELKFHLILWPIIAFFAATVLCSAIWAYHWKQVKMAESGFEKIEVPANSGGTTTEWRKTKEKKSEDQGK